MGELAANVAVFAALAGLGLALLVLVASSAAYARLRSPKLGFAALAFLAFSAKTAWLSWLAIDTRGQESRLLPIAVLDLAVIVLLYFAVVKRA